MARPTPLAAAAAAALVAVCLGAPVAHAQALTVGTREFRTWPDAVAALQSDVNAAGRVVHVTVREERGRSAGCRAYTLALDPVAAAAFVVDGCDESTGETVVRLVDRAALFDHSDISPRPRAAGITAMQLRTGGAAGGAANVGGSELRCSAAVRPFISDLENGRRVYLSPGRFVLRPRAADVTAAADGDGWMLRGTGHAALTIEYDVYDTERQQIVVHDRATLACGAEAVSDSAVTSAVTSAGNASAPVSYVSGGSAFEAIPSLPAAQPAHARSAVLFSAGIIGVGLMPLSDPVLNGYGEQRQGRDLGLGWDFTVHPPTGRVALTLEWPWILATGGFGWRTNGASWAVDLHATVAASVRTGSMLFYLGPTAVAWYLTTSDPYQRAWQLGPSVGFGGSLGARLNFENWVPDAHHFEVGDLFVELTAAPALGSTFSLVLGGSYGVGH